MATAGNPVFYGQGILNDGTSQNSQAVPLTGKQMAESVSTVTLFDAVPSAFFRRNFSSGTETVNITVPYDCIVINAWAVKTHGAEGTKGSTVVLKNGSDPIGTIALDGLTDQALKAITGINDAYQLLSAGATLALVNTQGGGGDSQCEVFVQVLKASAI